MAQLALLSHTGVERADRSAQLAVELFERRFPGQVRGYYLVGSYAVGEAIASSDVDVVVLFKGAPSDADRERFAETLQQCRAESPLPIDATAIGEPRLREVGGVWFQSASRLLYGEDVRDAIPRKPAANHVRDTMHAVIPLLGRVRDNPEQLHVPLDYPEPEGEFYGYDRRRMSLPDGTTCASTKNVVLIAIGAANALTLLAAGQYLGTG
ncbi:MAG TPA: nucleotidyltransferase domain-containing protein [Roseiflexaceae bacterium]|nr:nucleotidyltransferase domain-containing protein [Roseiflexaceae bacterium]